MTDEPKIDVLDKLRAELSAVAPSPEFAARVRVSLVDNGRAAFPGQRTAQFATVLSVAVLAALWLAASREWPVRPATTLPDPARPPVVATATALAPEALRLSIESKPWPARATRIPASHASRGPEVLIPPDQAVALRRLLTQLRQSRITMAPATEILVDVEPDGLPAPAAIRIPPITIDPLDESSLPSVRRDR